MVAVSKKIETKKYVRILKAKYESMWYADKIGEVFELTGETVSFYDVRVPGVGRLVNVEDAELIVTEKRPANRNDRILITNADTVQGLCKNGDEFVVDMKYAFCGNDVIAYKEYDINRLRAYYVIYKEYEVIVNNEIKNEEDNGLGKTYAFKPNLDAMGYDELIAHGEEVIRAISLRSYGEGYKQGKFDADMEANYMRKPGKTTQERRDEIVEQAKADVERLRTNNRLWRTFDITFDINRESRTVEAVAKKPNSRTAFYGTAICAPDDCFNIHIGEAIALHRALGLEVPDEYLNAPQPTEVREGDVVQAFMDGDLIFGHMVKDCEVDDIQKDVNTRGTSWYVKIIDDSRTGAIES
ncbi:hypothetical protein MOD67_13840 [Bacillus licheniformis]|uniref:hypothetical protein n=1 Tax=Bacillus TaxID=1386 RepID=UPI002280F6DA|nr:MULTISPECIES: hypothetical protein [Bacillus]MCY7861103.1 hypothetical protein [Bacillus haynesii]MCY8015568.1 hypothetical protein [Bacillus haynesii]MCY8291567.1 hypothetical protein [Bacillus haynesii]MCY8549191.1 hypothetical protein [Bacillus haynesii]MCY8745062.1 hypothetical protein [Bacillus licheniformis]